MSSDDSERKSGGIEGNEHSEKNRGAIIMTTLLEKIKEMLGVEAPDEEASRMAKGLVVVRISTKHTTYGHANSS